jgi:polysaccharide transporter, PST family
MSGAKSVIINASWMTVDQMFRMTVNLVVGAMIARHLGPSEMGALNFAVTLTSIVGVFAGLGLNRAIVRELTIQAGSEQAQRKVLATALGCRIAASVVCSMCTATTSLLFAQGDPVLVSIIAFGLVFNSSEIYELYFQSQGKSQYSTIAKLLPFLSFSAIKILLLTLESSAYVFAAFTTLETLANAISLHHANIRKGINIKPKDFDFDYAKPLVYQCQTELMAGAACVVFMRIDQVMIGNMLNNEAVGQYAAASRVAEAWHFIPAALVASSFPSIVKIREIDKKIYIQRIQQIMCVLTALSYATAITMSFLSEQIIDLIFGREYQQAVAPLIILAWCGLFISLGTISGSWIIAESQPAINLKRNALGAALNIALNYLLIPKFGITGAAWGSLIALATAYYASDFLSAKTREMGLIKSKALLLTWK